MADQAAAARPPCPTGSTNPVTLRSKRFPGTGTARTLQLVPPATEIQDVNKANFGRPKSILLVTDHCITVALTRPPHAGTLQNSPRLIVNPVTARG
ncbi:hypothetical protein GCM10009565_84570 [Amycolatopsis albidoflavus]